MRVQRYDIFSNYQNFSREIFIFNANFMLLLIIINLKNTYTLLYILYKGAH